MEYTALTMLVPYFFVVLMGLLAISVYTDLKFNKIRNLWVGVGTLLGVCAHFYLGGWNGLTNSLFGFLLGMGIFLPFYFFGGMAAGDVKLMAAVGSLLGIHLISFAVVLSLLSGVLLGFIYLAIRGDLKRFLNRYFLILNNFFATRKFSLSYLSPEKGEVAAQRFPYALAIASGVILSLIFFITRLPAYMLISY